MDLYDVGIMTLRGVSTSIFDVFFLFAVFAGYLVIVRFSQINIYAGTKMKSPKDMMIELIVQGIVIGIVFSFAVTFLGIPVLYTEYLYFILPMSFVLGYYHVKYTNIVYGALLLGVLGLIFNGQDVFGYTMPTVALSMSGLLGVVSVLLIAEGILLFLLRDNDMVPIVAKKEGHIILGFAMQRFWPIPVAVLAVTDAVSGGETIPMPEWWPILGGSQFGGIGYVMFLLPLMFVISHGSISFTKSPKRQLKTHAFQLLLSGGVLAVGAYLLDRFNGLEFLGVILMFAVSFVPEWVFSWQEEHDTIRFPKTLRGVRVIHVEYEGLGQSLGFKAGDLIKEINGIEVTTLYQMLAIFKDRHTHFVLQIQSEDFQMKEVKLEKQALVDGGLQMMYLPDEPEKIFDYDQVKQMGMMHLLKFHSLN